MSRSYKQTPYCGDTKTKWAKRQANKLVRSKMKKWNIQDDVFPSYYKKISESWNICDYYSIMTLNEWLEMRSNPLHRVYMRHKEYNEEEEIQNWCKWYKRK